MAEFYRSIEGWFDFDDIYDLAIGRYGSNSARFVEIGAYKGRSTCYLAERIRETGLAIRFDVVDTFAGDVHIGYLDLWPEFAANLERAGLLSSLAVHRCLSTEAAATFEDQSVDFVFIDATHSFDAASQDIAAWWPKLRSGALLAGHDYTNFPEVAAAVNAFVANCGLHQGFRSSRSSWMVDKP